MDPALFLLIALLTLLLISNQPNKSLCQEIESVHSLDLFVRDYTFKTYIKTSNSSLRTAELRAVNLPENLTDVRVDIARYRCGSLTRYGARVGEFRIGVGVTVHPCVERVLVIRQVLGFNWSSLFYSNYDLSGYRLVSPVLGLMAYNARKDPFQIELRAGQNPITVNFSDVATVGSSRPGAVHLCASFGSGREMTVTGLAGDGVCRVVGDGHFGLVVADLGPEQAEGRPIRASRWKVAVGSSIGAALGAFLLGLLVVAMLVKSKKKSRREEMERRAYEEEALQVSMVGHVRAPTAAGTRTMPVIEHGYSAPHR